MQRCHLRHAWDTCGLAAVQVQVLNMLGHACMMPSTQHHEVCYTVARCGTELTKANGRHGRHCKIQSSDVALAVWAAVLHSRNYHQEMIMQALWCAECVMHVCGIQQQPSLLGPPLVVQPGLCTEANQLPTFMVQVTTSTCIAFAPPGCNIMAPLTRLFAATQPPSSAAMAV